MKLREGFLLVAKFRLQIPIKKESFKQRNVAGTRTSEPKFTHQMEYYHTMGPLFDPSL